MYWNTGAGIECYHQTFDISVTLRVDGRDGNVFVEAIDCDSIGVTSINAHSCNDNRIPKPQEM